MKPLFHKSAVEFREWLERNHQEANELWVGFYKRDSGRTGITYPEALDEALCFGWIDGIRKSVGKISYMIRFTPRRPDSIWSRVNTTRVRKLTETGRMRLPGLRAFQERDRKKSEKHFHERKHSRLDADSEERFRSQKTAWDFFQAQAPWYRRTAIWWVVSARKEETRLKRLATLIEDSANGRRLAMPAPKSRNQPS
jgi:uncharacterized protein YdeI (YjbR/CyaY-like superfamily)